MSRFLTIALVGGAAFLLFRMANLTRDNAVIDAGGENSAVAGSTFSPEPISSTAEGVDFADFFDPPASSPGGAGSTTSTSPAPVSNPPLTEDLSDVGP